MKASKLSLATLFALGALTFATAEEAGTEKAEELKPAEGKTLLLDALKATTISGSAYWRYTGMFGDDASGTALRSRVDVVVDTGSYKGFSLGARVRYTSGVTSPDGGTFIKNSGNPYDSSNLIGFGLYGTQTFASTTTTLKGGKVNIDAPFVDSGADAGYGLNISNADLEGVRFTLQGYGAFGLDTQDWLHNQAFSSDKAMFIFGIDGDSSKLAGVGFKAYAAHVIDTIDFLTYLNVNYGIAGVKLDATVATTQVNTGSKFFKVGGENGQDDTAKLRGLYNFQVSYNSDQVGIEVKAGYTGSFGDGYGALLNYAAFNMGGKFWFDTAVDRNGYAVAGVGGRKVNGQATTIQVGYVGIQYSGVTNLGIGLDYAYIGGNNNYALMQKGQSNNSGKTNMNAQLHEVSFTASYNFSKRLSLSALVGSTFGDLTQGRGRAQLTYSF